MKAWWNRTPAEVSAKERQIMNGESGWGIWVVLLLIGSAIWWFLQRLPGSRETSVDRVDPVSPPKGRPGDRLPIGREPAARQTPARMGDASASSTAAVGLAGAAAMATAGSANADLGVGEHDSERSTLPPLPSADEPAGNQESEIDDRLDASTYATGADVMGGTEPDVAPAWSVDEAGGADVLVEESASLADLAITDGDRVPDATTGSPFAAGREPAPTGGTVGENEAAIFADRSDAAGGWIADTEAAGSGEAADAAESASREFEDVAGARTHTASGAVTDAPDAAGATEDTARWEEDAAGKWTLDADPAVPDDLAVANAASDETLDADGWVEDSAGKWTLEDADVVTGDTDLVAEAESLGIAVSPIWTAGGSDLPAERFAETEFADAETPFELPTARPDSTFPSLDLPGFTLPGSDDPEWELPSGEAASAAEPQPEGFFDRVRDTVAHAEHDILDDDQITNDRAPGAVIPDTEAPDFPVAAGEPDLFLPDTFAQSEESSARDQVDTGFSTAAPAADFAGFSTPTGEPFTNEDREPGAVTAASGPDSGEGGLGDTVFVDFEAAIASPLGEREGAGALGAGVRDFADAAAETVDADAILLASEAPALDRIVAERAFAAPEGATANVGSTSETSDSTAPDAGLAGVLPEDGGSPPLEDSTASPGADSWIEAQAARWQSGYTAPEPNPTGDARSGSTATDTENNSQTTGGVDTVSPSDVLVLPPPDSDLQEADLAPPVDLLLAESFAVVPADDWDTDAPADAVNAATIPGETTFAFDSARESAARADDSALVIGDPGETLDVILADAAATETGASEVSGASPGLAAESVPDALDAVNTAPGIVISQASGQPAESTGTPDANARVEGALGGAESAHAAMQQSLPGRAARDSAARPEDERMYARAESTRNEAAGSAEGAQVERPLPVGGVAPLGDRCPASHPIKGNLQSMIYHAPGWPSFAVTEPEVCFADDQSAAAAGFRRPKNAPESPGGSGVAGLPEVYSTPETETGGETKTGRTSRSGGDESMPTDGGGRGMASNAGRADEAVVADASAPDTANAADADAAKAAFGPDATQTPMGIAAAPAVAPGERRTGAGSSRARKTAAGEPHAKESRAKQVFVPAGAVAGDGSQTCPKDHPVKGNAKSRLYHLPGQSSYEQTIAEVCFGTATDADNAGYRAVGSR